MISNNPIKDENYSWVFVLLFFFILTAAILCYVINRNKKNVVHPKQVYLIQKDKNKSFNTIDEIQEDINKEKEKALKNKKSNKKKLDKEAYKLFLKKKYPNVEFELANQLYKNKKLMAKVHEKIKKSKIKKSKIKKSKKKLKITEIPTEKADLETMMKTDKVKPNFKTVASMRVKNDKILKMMRERKLVKNNRFKK